MMTTTIRIDHDVYLRLKQVAEREQLSLGATVNLLLDRYEQAEFRRAVHESFRRLREDPAAWADYRREVAAWDATLMDGLEDEPLFDDDVAGKR